LGADRREQHVLPGTALATARGLGRCGQS
jgi:hypothetical protein